MSTIQRRWFNFFICALFSPISTDLDDLSSPDRIATAQTTLAPDEGVVSTTPLDIVIFVYFLSRGWSLHFFTDCQGHFYDGIIAS